MIIVPDDPGEAGLDEVFKAVVLKVFDGDGFLATVWHPFRETWVERIPFRFAFIDAPEMGQPCGPEARDFLAGLIAGKELRLDPVGKESTGYMPIDPYKRLLCVGFLTEQMEAGRIDYYHQGRCGSGLVKRPRPVTRNIELEMVVNGWAWVVEQYSFGIYAGRYCNDTCWKGSGYRDATDPDARFDPMDAGEVMEPEDY